MKIDLSGKLAIVSGSTGGIGLGISLSLAEAGATVVVIGREAAKVEQALASIRQQVPGAQLRGLTADLGTAEGRAHMASNARPLWTALPDGVLKRQLLGELADLTQLKAQDLSDLWGQATAKSNPRMPGPGTPASATARP